MYTYKYPHPAVTTDAVIWAMDRQENAVKVLLIKRKNEPFRGSYAFPGGFVDENESAEQCVVRELEEETCLTGLTLIQMRTFSEPGRDPRGHTVSVVFFSMTDIEQTSAKAGDDAAYVEWVPLKQIYHEHKRRPFMAFDHFDILSFSALFVWRNVFLFNDIGNPHSLFYPFASVLEQMDLSLLETTCLTYKDEFDRFRAK